MVTRLEMSPRTSLRAFLANARAALAAPPGQRPNPLTFVVGNESADLDSLCSAVVFAYLRTTTRQNASLHIPLSNLPRADLALRPELTAALAHAQLKPSDLLTLDELPETIDQKNTRWLLVDHNALTGTLLERGFDARVVGCVDHHADEGKVPRDTGDEPRVIEKTGSCSSLVASYCHEAWEGALDSSSDPRGEADKHAAMLLLAAILVDTANLKAADRTTDRDVESAGFLESKFLKSSAYVRDEYFEELNGKKEDLSGMGLRDIFRKDYKQWSEPGGLLGTSSVARGIGYLLEDKAHGDPELLAQEFGKWASEKKLDVAAIMTTLQEDDQFKRELLVWAFNDSSIRAVEDFVKTNEQELQLETWGGGALDRVGDGQWRRAWKQGNITHSRKRIAPMLRDALQSQLRL